MPTRKRAMCSPIGHSRKKKHTCFNDESLMKIKTFWNHSYPTKQIRSNNAKEIWKQIHSRMNNVCEKENCWLEQPFMRGKIDDDMRDSFAPNRPDSWKKNPNEWLSSVDITNVLRQYEKYYKCFKFLGPFPIDFDNKKGASCVEDEMCQFNLKQYLDDKKTKIGFVFNTDPHDKGGEHWISLFINAKSSEIFFFDSAGDKILPEIKKFVAKVKEQGKQMNPPIFFNFDENGPFNHQKTTTECGMYSLYFIINMLRDKTNKKLLKSQRVPDSLMTNYRKVYFN